MFFSKKLIIVVSRKEIVAALVDRWRKKIVTYKSFAWEEGNLGEVFSEITKQYKDKNIRILFTKDSYYSLTITDADESKENITRPQIFEKIKELIPEVLGENDWDFVISGENIFVFAPVARILTKLKEVVGNSHYKVEAVEPEEYSKNRHPNPIIGLAIKKALKGKDQEILNLRIK